MTGRLLAVAYIPVDPHPATRLITRHDWWSYGQMKRPWAPFLLQANVWAVIMIGIVSCWTGTISWIISRNHLDPRNRPIVSLSTLQELVSSPFLFHRPGLANGSKISWLAGTSLTINSVTARDLPSSIMIHTVHILYLLLSCSTAFWIIWRWRDFYRPETHS